MIDTDSSDTDEDNKNQTLQKSTPKGSVNDVSNDYIISNPKSGQNGSLDNISLISSGSPKPSRTSSNASTKLFNRNEISSISNFSSDGISNDDFRADSEHMKRLQLYVFVSRCIAYPFNAKQSTDMARRASKVTKQNLTTIKDRFTSFLDGKTNIIADEAFRIAVQSYYDSFLCCDRVHKMVNSGGYSANDFREIFKANITKRVRSIPDIQGLSKETVLSSWMAKFDAIYRGDEDQKRTPARLAATAASELILSKEQLYEMFQTVLGVKKYEHQILFNACQLDNSDEQAAWIRRELNSRQKILSTLSKETMPKFIHKNMEEIYIEEQKAMVKSLMSIHLDGFPPTKSGSEGKSGFPKMKRGQNNVISMMDVNDDNEVLIKAVSGLSFKLQVTVMEASGLSSIRQNRIIFVVMELEGDSKLQTDQAEAGAPFLLKIIYTFRLEKFGSYIHTHPNFFLKDFLLYIIERWETQGDWTTNQPLPILKLRLMAEQSSKLMLSDDKELACVTITPHCGMQDNYEWYTMVPHKSWSGDTIKLKVSIKMERPQNVKKGGFLYAKGQNIWKQWKKRYFMLIQVSQYKFVLCSYRPKKQSPREVMGVESYTVNFTEKTEEELEGGRFFFNIVKAGDEVLFAADENADRVNWVYNLCNATGQSFKPSFPKPPSGADRVIQKIRGDMDRALKHGLGDIVQANPFEFDQAEMFAMLQRLTLLHRLNDSYTCLGWFSPGQLFVLDEYCARYGVRGCHRHLCYLADLLERAENGTMIDPTLFHYSYAFCASHVVGNRPDGVNTVTVDEKERFDEMKNRLKSYLANQITHFRYCFPFGRPEGALKSTLTIFERVLSKDTMMPSADPEDSEDVKQAIRDCLRRAALVNYTRLSSYAKVEVYSFSPKNKWALSMHDSFQGNVSPQEKLGIIIQLAELCIELIQQNEEHHSEALAWYHELMTEHTEIFWSLFAVDMDEALDSQPPDTWDSFALFQMLNNYLRMESSLRGGKFHTHLMEKFSPSIVRYIDLMESSIARSVDKGFAKETYQSVGHGCATSEEVFWKLSSIQAFIQDLHWPDEIFAEHIATRLKRMAADMTEAIVNRVSNDIRRHLVGKVNLEYVIPVEVCVMINVLCRADEQADELCTVEDLSYPEEISYHTNIKDFIHKAQMDSIALIIDKLCSIMKELLKKLARYDQGKLSSKILNLMKPTEDVAEDFYHFVVRNIRELRKTVECESYVFTLEKALWEKLCSLLCSWLVQRQEVALHVYQFKVLSNIVEPCRKLFEQEGLTQNDLENDDYKAAYSKLQLEEAMLNLTEPTILTREIEVKSYESKIQKGDSDYEDD